MECLEKFQSALYQSLGQWGIYSNQIESDWELINYSFKINKLQSTCNLLLTPPPGDCWDIQPRKCVWNYIRSFSFSLMKLLNRPRRQHYSDRFSANFVNTTGLNLDPLWIFIATGKRVGMDMSEFSGPWYSQLMKLEMKHPVSPCIHIYFNSEFAWAKAWIYRLTVLKHV